MAAPDVEDRLRSELELLAREIDAMDESALLGHVSRAATRHERRRLALVGGSALAGLAIVVGAALLSQPSPRIEIGPVAPSGGEPESSTDEADAWTTAVTGVGYRSSHAVRQARLTDVADAVPGDGGEVPVRLGADGSLPDSIRLELLWDRCDPLTAPYPRSGDERRSCERIPHFVDQEGRGSHYWLDQRPFHIAAGFPAPGPDPLEAGFDAAVYVTLVEEGDPGDPDHPFEPGETVHYTTDLVVRGQAVGCGPTYREQFDPVDCEWFVHEFPEGLTEGTYEIVVAWEAPCHAWVEYGLADGCDDPDRVESRYSSLFEAQIGHWVEMAQFVDRNHAGLTNDEIMQVDHGMTLDGYHARVATLDALVESFNDGRLDDYVAALAPGVDAPGQAVRERFGVEFDRPFDLVDRDMVAALMGAEGLWVHWHCGPGDGFDETSDGVITCGTEIVDRFHPEESRPVRGDLTYSFDDDGRIAAIEPDRSYQSRSPSTIERFQARRAYGLAFRDWLVEAHPDVAAPMLGRWLANGMPHPADVPVALEHVDEFPGAATTTSSSPYRKQFYDGFASAWDESPDPEGDDAVHLAWFGPRVGSHIPVIISNSSGTSITRVEVTGRASDGRGGTVVIGSSRSVEPDVVPAGGLAFGFVVVDAEDEDLSADEVLGDPVIDFVRSPAADEDVLAVGWSSRVRLGDSWSGQVTNHNGRAVGGIQVHIACLTRDGRVVVASPSIGPDRLDRGESSTFTVDVADFPDDEECVATLFGASGSTDP